MSSDSASASDSDDLEEEKSNGLVEANGHKEQEAGPSSNGAVSVVFVPFIIGTSSGGLPLKVCIGRYRSSYRFGSLYPSLFSAIIFCSLYDLPPLKLSCSVELFFSPFPFSLLISLWLLSGINYPLSLCVPAISSSYIFQCSQQLSFNSNFLQVHSHLFFSSPMWFLPFSSIATFPISKGLEMTIPINLNCFLKLESTFQKIW